MPEPSTTDAGIATFNVSARRLPILVAPCVLTLFALSAAGQSISAIGVLPGWNRSEPNALSADGSTVVGQLINGSDLSQSRAFRWSRAGGTVDLGTLGFGSVAGARGVSEDGFAVSGSTQGPGGLNVTFRWTQLDGMVLVDPLGNGMWSGNGGMSASGLELAGTSVEGGSIAAYRWSTYLGGQNLGNPFGSGAFGSAISASGFAVAGNVNAPFELPPPVGLVNGSRAFRWSVVGGMQILSAEWSEGRAISGDGSVVVGHATSLDGTPYRAIRWSGGGAQNLGNTFPDGPSVFATAVSGDGLTVGGSTSGASGRGWIWKSGLGMVNLNAYLPTVGIDLTGWVIGEVRGISIDGMVLTGLAGFNGTSRGYVVDLRKDSDGDGLYDHWETEGIPYFDQDGVVQRYILPGANPLRKDIFVEVDAMVGRQPSPGAMSRVIEAFDQSPVPAVPGLAGGLPGIALHLDVDDISIPARDYGEDTRWADFQADKLLFSATAAERSRPDHTGLRSAKAKAYRYCIFAKRIPNGVLGVGEMDSDAPANGPRKGGNDLMVATGDYVPPLGSIEDLQAGLFMHELGHTLGLYHGGADPFQNLNPNHYSVMNYTWVGTREFAVAGTAVLLDYSRQAMPALNENALDETIGIQGMTPSLVLPIYVRAVNTPGTCGFVPDPETTGGRCDVSLNSVFCMNYVYFSGPVDWNNDGIISPASRPVCADCNGDYSESVSLACPNEWELLAYNFRDSPHYSNAIAPPDSSPCPTVEMETFLSSLPPPPPPVECPVAPPTAPSPSPAISALCGSAASFTVAPVGTGPFTVQWRWLDHSEGAPTWVDFVEGWSQDIVLVAGAQEATLQIHFAAASFFGAGAVEVSCRMTDVCGQSADSGSGTLLIGGTTLLETSATDVVACQGSTAQFSVSASSAAAPVTYRWLQGDSEEGFELVDGTLTHGTIVSGAESPTLSLSNIAVADFPELPETFACIADDGCSSDSSQEFSFSARGVLITRHPESVDLPCTGTPEVSFVAEAVGIAPLTYQWLLGGMPLQSGGRVNGADTAELTITDPQSQDSGAYTCVVTAACGSVETEAGWLEVGSPRLLVDPPHIPPACLHNLVYFQAPAIGTQPITYQWMRNGIDLVNDGRVNGAQSQGLLIFDVRESDLADYSVRITNSCGTLVSQSSALALFAPIVIATQPASSIVCPAGSVTLSFELALEQAGLSFNWEIEDPLYPNSWQFVSDGPIVFDQVVCAEASGSSTHQLTVSLAAAGSCVSSFQARCTIYHQCEFVQSNPATIRICRADFDCSGAVAVPDIFSFLAAWFAQDSRADFNSDGQIQVPDIFEYLAEWFAGCA